MQHGILFLNCIICISHLYGWYFWFDFQYRIAQMYMVTKMQQQQTGGGEGVEVLINRPFENEEYGRGQYTSKIYHLQR